MENLVSDCCGHSMIPPASDEEIEMAGSMWRAYASYICKKCSKACGPVPLEEYKDRTGEVEAKTVYAKDMACVKCKKPAVAFWPMVDPDIPHHPYCRECLDKAKNALMIKLLKAAEGNKQ